MLLIRVCSVARCSGDPADPLILYLHGSGAKSRNNTGKMWNGLVTSLAAEMQNAHAAIEKKQKDALEMRCAGIIWLVWWPPLKC